MVDDTAVPASRLRDMSRRLVLAELARTQPTSQAEVVRRTGLSRATVASVVAELIDAGRLVPADGPAPAGRGRPPQLLGLSPGLGLIAGIDYGHSHVAVALADLSGTILAEQRVELDVDSAAATAMDAAVDMLAGLVETAGITDRPRVVVIGVPGPIDRRTGELRSGTILPDWVGIQPAQEFGRRLGQSVLLENDANLGAIGEHAYGVARGVADVLYVKVSSGIGAGMVLNGRIYRGSRGTAGELGHVQVADDGAICRCGSRGCLETLSSADAALVLLRAVHGPSLTIEDVMRIVRAGDPGAVRLFTDMGTAIGRVLGAAASNLDPEMIVVGGPVVDDPGPLLHGISAAVRRYTQPYVGSELTVVGATLGPRAGLLGALALAIETAAAD